MVFQTDASNETILTPFSVKDGMSLATAPCTPLQDTAEFDRCLQLQNKDYSSDYLELCKLRLRNRKDCRSRPASKKIEVSGDDDDDVILVPSGNNVSRQTLPKYKLLQFAENHRPAYYGTWRKTGSINPRNPFRKDEVRS